MEHCDVPKLKQALLHPDLMLAQSLKNDLDQDLLAIGNAKQLNSEISR